jgi:hypothetical protein
MAEDDKAGGAGTPPPSADGKTTPAPAPAAAKPAADAAGAGAADDKTTPAKTDPGDKDAAAPPPAKAPDKYAFTVPAGAEPFFDASDLDTIAAVAREHDLSQEDAQAVLVAEAKSRDARIKALEQQTLKDPDYGGAKFSETQQLARKVIDRVRPAGHARTAAFNQLLLKTGYGNHIEVVSFLADLGRLMSEDAPSAQRPGGGSTRDAAEVLYGKPPTA